MTVHHRANLLSDALEVMRADYHAALTVDEVARRIATSRRQLQRCFHEHGDAGFRECLVGIRMENAARLLAETPVSVRDVAARVGYRQPPQFAKAFRRVHGVAPAEYRAQSRLAVAA